MTLSIHRRHLLLGAAALAVSAAAWAAGPVNVDGRGAVGTEVPCRSGLTGRALPGGPCRSGVADPAVRDTR